MGIVELQPEEISRGARLPKQAELEVGGGRELMTTGDVEPVLVEIAIAVVEIDEGFVESVDEVSTGLHGLVVKRYRDLQPVAPPIGVVVVVIILKPALLKAESMLESRARPSLFHGKLLIKPVFDPVAAIRVIIIVGPGIDAHVAETDHGYFVNVIVARNPKEGLVQVRCGFPEAHLALPEKAPVV